MGKEFYNTANLVISNSSEIQRRCINAVLSGLMQIEISDDVVLQKNNNRKIKVKRTICNGIYIWINYNSFTR